MKFLKKLTAVLCSAAVSLSLFTSVCVSSAATAQNVILRVEGQKTTLFSDKVNFTGDQSAYDILAAALASENIPIVASVSSYGHYITSIGGETGTYPVYWHFYVNGKSSEVGADSVKPADGDQISFYIGDDSQVLYPTVKFSPQSLVAGQRATVNVSATYTDYSDSNNPVAKTVNISGVTVTLNGKTYTTDTDGNAAVTMPAAGNYTLTAVKEAKDTTPAIVRTGDISVTVAASPATSSGNTKKPTKPVTKNSSKTAITTASINAAINNGVAYALKSGVSDWNAAVASYAAGRSGPQSFFDTVKEDLASGTPLPVHLAGVIIGIRAAGGNPRSFNRSDLVAQLYNSTAIGKTGLNGYAYGLLAFDCGNYVIPASAPVSRQNLISSILSYQKKNGAFSLAKTSGADSDMTAITVTALAPYTKQAKVKAAVNKAIGYLSKIQKKDGGFLPSYSTSECSESTSQVIIALSSVGIDAQKDKRFIKNGNTPLTALFKYKKANGGFAHTLSGSSDNMATEQAVTALAAYRNYKSSGKRIYNMTSVKAAKFSTKVEPAVENPDTGDAETGAGAGVIIISAAGIAFAALINRLRRGKTRG